jgi:hypothetical protein
MASVQVVPKRKSEAGMVIVMMALLSVVLLSLIGFALGIGFLATERSRLHTIGNLTALAAIDQYIRLSPEDNAEADRRTATVARANFVVSKNKLIGTSSPLGDLGNSTPDDGGVIRFGNFFRKDPGSDPCSGVYPCFKEAATSGAGNAVQVNLQNQSDNKIVRPLAGFLSAQKEFQLDTTSYATLVNTCVGHLMDASVSVTAGTNTPFTNAGVCAVDAPCNECTANDTGKCFHSNAGILLLDPIVSETDSTGTYNFSTASLFAYDAKKIFIGGDPANGMIDCTSTADSDSNSIFDGIDNINANFPDLLYWCNMHPSRADYELNWAGDGTTPQPAPAGMMFRSDYEYQKVFRGKRKAFDSGGNEIESSYMMVNKKVKPTPMQEFLLGANMALRIGERLPSESNKGFFWAFTGEVLNRAEPQRYETGTTNDKISGSTADLKTLVTANLAYLTQLTNMDILGGLASDDGSPGGLATIEGVPDTNQQHPNLLDSGFFPMAAARVPPGVDPTLAATNPILVLYEAARVLNTACDLSARRSIFLYTDGIGTCEYMPAEFTSEVTTASNCLSKSDGGVETAWPNYEHYEYALLKVLIPYFQDLGLSVHVILDGPHVAPNYINREDPNHPDSTASGGSGCSSSSDYNCFVDFNSASQAGYQGMQAGADKSTLNVCDTTKSLFGCASSDRNGVNDDRQAFLDSLSGYSNVTFGRATAVMGELAMKTGGQFCPLMNPGPVGDYIDHDGDYPPNTPSTGCSLATAAECCQNIFSGATEAEGRTPCRLKNTERTKDAVENRSVEFLPKSYQAAICAQRALATSPFLMAEPLTTVLN